VIAIDGVVGQKCNCALGIYAYHIQVDILWLGFKLFTT